MVVYLHILHFKLCYFLVHEYYDQKVVRILTIVVLFGDWLILWCVLVVYNENPTRIINTTLLKCCLSSTDAIDRQEKNTRMRIRGQGCLMQARFIDIQQCSAQKKSSDTFLADHVYLYIHI
jgi:hypothetical protein